MNHITDNLSDIVTSAAVLAIVVFMLVGCACETQPTATPEQSFGASMSHTQSVNHVDAGMQGFHSEPGIQIYWAGLTSDGADTLGVVNAVIGRIQFEQDTDALASDQNARALAHLMLARQTLEGKSTTTEDGLPILE